MNEVEKDTEERIRMVYKKYRQDIYNCNNVSIDRLDELYKYGIGIYVDTMKDIVAHMYTALLINVQSCINDIRTTDITNQYRECMNSIEFAEDVMADILPNDLITELYMIKINDTLIILRLVVIDIFSSICEILQSIE